MHKIRESGVFLGRLLGQLLKSGLPLNGNNIMYFESFGVEHIPKGIKTFTGNKSIKTNIHRM